MGSGGGDRDARGPHGTRVLEQPPAPVDASLPIHARVTLRAPAGSQDSRTGARAGSTDITSAAEKRVASRHQLGKMIGKGGMGEVYVAVDPALRRRVAFKRLLPEHHKNPNLSARFLTEVEVTSQLDHPNIVPINGFELAEDGSFGYSMKLVKGRDLAGLIEKWRGEAPTYRAPEARRRLASRLDIFLRICEAMTYAHDKGVLHRDLKPENVMVGTFNDVYVMDWGIFRIIGDSSAEDRVSLSPEVVEDAGHGKTLDGMVLGTPGYMSPEQADGKVSTLDARSDLFTLGLILAELITLRSPRPASSVEEALALARNGFVPPLVSSTPHSRVPRELRAIVVRATRLDPADRYASVRELSDDLRRYLRGDAVSAAPDNPVQRMARWLGRHRMVALVTILALVAVGAGVVAWQIRASSEVREALMRRHARHQSLAVITARHADELDGHFARWQTAAATLVGRATEVMAVRRGGDDATPGTTTLYLAPDYDAGRGPADLTLSRRYGRPASVDAPVVQLAPGLALAGDAAHEAAAAVGLHTALRDALLATSPDTRALSDDAARTLLLDTGVPALRAFVTSATGVHVSFPGTGGFAADYDGRARKKYTSALVQAARPGSVAWGDLFADRHGLGLVLPVSGVLFDRGAVRGVAGIELSLVWIAEQLLAAEVAGAEEFLLLDAAGRVIVRLVPGRAPEYATTEGPGESEVVRFATFSYDEARRAVAGPEAGVVELPDRRLVALYPLSTIRYTFVIVAR